jgi:hypothetical protein
VDRGTCSFVTKVRNIEKAGGSLAVIIDNQVEDIKNVIMSDDGTGTGIRIPAMLIGKKEGKILKDFLLSANSNKSEASLSAEFVLENLENKVRWQIWYTSVNDKALDFIKNFGENLASIESAVDFTPHYVTWSCTACDSDWKKKECVSNGRYCSMNHQGTYINGSNIIMEDLRQHCLHKLVKAEGKEHLWWDYM